MHRNHHGMSRPLGLKVAFHHHVGSHVETPEEIDRLFSSSPADELGLCLDTGHYVYGGGDTIAFLEKQVARVWCVHLKDMYDEKRQPKHHKQTDEFSRGDSARSLLPVGKESIDFPEVIALLRGGNFDGWVVVEADVLPGGAGADAPLPMLWRVESIFAGWECEGNQTQAEGHSSGLSFPSIPDLESKLNRRQWLKGMAAAGAGRLLRPFQGRAFRGHFPAIFRGMSMSPKRPDFFEDGSGRS